MHEVVFAIARSLQAVTHKAPASAAPPRALPGPCKGTRWCLPCGYPVCLGTSPCFAHIWRLWSCLPAIERPRSWKGALGVAPPPITGTGGLESPAFAEPAIKTRRKAILGSTALLHMLSQQERKSETPGSAHWASQVHIKQKLGINFFTKTFCGPLLFWPWLYLFFCCF